MGVTHNYFSFSPGQMPPTGTLERVGTMPHAFRTLGMGDEFVDLAKIPMTKAPNPNQGPMTKSQNFSATAPPLHWSLEIGSWDLIGIWGLGHWGFSVDRADVDFHDHSFSRRINS
jgi:hypothetical protein